MIVYFVEIMFTAVVWLVVQRQGMFGCCDGVFSN